MDVNRDSGGRFAPKPAGKDPGEIGLLRSDAARNVILQAKAEGDIASDLEFEVVDREDGWVEVRVVNGEEERFFHPETGAPTEEWERTEAAIRRTGDVLITPPTDANRAMRVWLELKREHASTKYVDAAYNAWVRESVALERKPWWRPQ